MLSIAAAALVLGQQAAPAKPAVIAETPEQKQARMKWWTDARFGLFIHWGLYAIPAGKWGNETGYGEWIRDSAKIPVKEYEKFRDQFNPTAFNADEWARMAKDAGMRYVVITSKHHDGFDLFATKQNSDWNVMATPFKRDVMEELSTAVRKQGLTMCWYHSIMDWHHPDYLPRRPWEVADRPVDGADFERFNQYLRSQVTELLTNYGPIGVMWFDGQWESTWNDSYGIPLYNLCRTLQPKVIVNNRVSNSGVGDYSTPEQYIPPTGLPNTDWETCMTMNEHWGYNAYDTDWKSSRTLIRNLVDIVSKGGNYLLNVGPKADGTFPTEAVDRLRDIGAWMKVNSASIYGTKPSVFAGLPWGRSTTKGSTIYLQVFDWPADGSLELPGLANKVRSARILGSSEKVAVRKADDGVVLTVPTSPVNADCTVVELKLDGKPVIYKAPTITTASDLVVDSTPVTLVAPEGMEVRYTVDGSEPTASSPIFRNTFTVTGTTTVRAASFLNARRVSAIVSTTITKVAPEPATSVEKVQRGLNLVTFEGSYDKLPDFESLSANSLDAVVSQGVELPVDSNGKPRENVGMLYRGYLNVPADGVYRFELTSDDGSKLWIDQKVVVDNDGLHTSETKSGSVALAKGWHRIALGWFNASGGADLSLRWGKVGTYLHGLAAPEVGH